MALSTAGRMDTSTLEFNANAILLQMQWTLTW